MLAIVYGFRFISEFIDWINENWNPKQSSKSSNKEIESEALEYLYEELNVSIKEENWDREKEIKLTLMEEHNISEETINKYIEEIKKPPKD